ncbi:hypothetical protein BU204_22420 [Actinophytocola xanthii]|uniref:Uncharacterized protein n=1 Tax=Actinophytocola xanthii TaxID=1912961 RepID=A0A1Q8CLT8_9PSEU|nr:hypothetical protein BU204_22420 [Actinophytocola xanthii]
MIVPIMSVPCDTAETRALLLWGLIVDLINAVGSSADSRRRNTLIAAFRLPRRPEITEPWKSSLGDRFRQLMAVPGIFGDPTPTTTTPMHRAWNRGLTERLVPALTERLEVVAAGGSDWQQYVKLARKTEVTLAREHTATSEPRDSAIGYRRPSKSAQPVFLDLFVTTVFMRARTVYRRITERLVTAREDNVDAYMATALGGSVDETGLTDIPVRPLWGCRAEILAPTRPGDPVLTRLVFPTTLHRGQKHYFSSEAVNEGSIEERVGVNVEVDHHGIAPGKLLHGHVPISGLTIRVRFDEHHVPETTWWYAEQTERERREPPPDKDPRLLTIVDGAVEHTFMGKCQPRENYGIRFLWPEP